MSAEGQPYEPVEVAIALSLYGYNVSPRSRALPILERVDGATMDGVIASVQDYGSAPTSLSFSAAEVYVDLALALYGEEARRRVQAERRVRASLEAADR